MTNTLVNPGTLTKNAESDFTTQGNLPVQESKLMSIDMANAAFIMESLTNLYSDPYLSVIREYVANAIDSHIVAGNPAPVQVTLPNDWSSNLVIADQGIGMSYQDVFRYGDYGSSDKRENLNVVGNFGMGSKSALSITNSFTISAVKDGEHTLATIGRNDDGFGQVDIISHSTTDQPNGVTISIPITSRNFWQVTERAEKVIQFLPAGRVSVDGKVNTDIRDSLTKLSDDIHVSKVEWGYKYLSGIKVTVISGGFGYRVPYDVLNEAARSLPDEFFALPREVYIDVPTGSIDLTPSREELRLTSRTKSLIIQAVKATTEKTSKTYKDKLDAVSTFDDAFKFISEASTPTYASQIISMCSNLVVPKPDNPITYLIRTGYGVEKSPRNTEIAEYISYSQDNKVIILENDKDYSENSLTGRVRSFLSKVSQDYGKRTPVMVLNPQFVDDPSIKEDTLYRYLDRTGIRMKASEIYAAVNEYNKANRSTVVSYGSTGTGDAAVIDTLIFDGETKKFSALYPVSGSMSQECPEAFDNDLPIVYVLNNTRASGLDMSADRVQEILAVRAVTVPNDLFNVVLIAGSNRKEKYFTSRGVPVISVKDFHKKVADDLLTEDARVIYRELDAALNEDEYRWEVRRTCEWFQGKRPALSDKVDLIIAELKCTISPTTSAVYSHLRGYSRVTSLVHDVAKHSSDPEEAQKFYEELTNDSTGIPRDDLVTYTLQAVDRMIKHGHKDEGYAMLDTLVTVMTKKKED